MKEKFLVSLISKIGSYVVYTFALYLLTFKLGVDSFGIWTFLNSTINLGFLFIDVGLDQIHYQYSGKKDFSNYFSTFLFLKLIIILINVFTALVITSILQLWTSEFLFFILFLLASKIFMSITQIFTVNLNTKLKIIISEIFSLTFVLFKCVLVFILFLNYESIINPIFYLCSTFFINDLLALAVILLISYKDIKFTKLDREITYLYLKDQTYLLIGSVFIVLYTNLGNVLLYYYFGETSLGYMSLVVVFIIPTLLLFSDSFISIYLSYFPKSFENNDIASITQITYTVEKYSSILFLTIIILLFLVGQSIILITFPKYEPSIVILNIMIFIPYLIGTTQPYSYHIVTGKKIKMTVFINSLTRLIALFLIFILVPSSIFTIQTFGLGLIGYAIAHTLPWILWFFLCRYFSFKYFGIKSRFRTLIHIPLALITLIVSLIIKNIFLTNIPNQIHVIIIISLISISIFFLLLILAKELRKEDILLFIQLLNIGNYKRAFKEELKN